MKDGNPDGWERLRGDLKAACESIDPSPGTRRRIRDRAFAAAEAPRRRLLARDLAWVAVAVLPWVVAVALFLHVTSPGERASGGPSGEAERGTPPARGGSGEVLAFGPHRVELGPGARLEPLGSAGGSYEFELAFGRAVFRVAPLEPGARFAVRAGDALVEVVGTVFSVERDGRCVRVAVERGAVRAAFGPRRVELAAGQADEACAPPDGVAGRDGPGPGSDIADAVAVSRPGSRRASAAGAGTPREDDPEEPPASAGPTDEERLYREALDARLAGDVPRCRELMGRYAAGYPDGLFFDEALFTLVRLDYRAGDFASARERSGRYLARNRYLEAKTAEVRLLRADSLERLGGGGVLAELRPLAGSIDVLAPEYREQALYLLALSAERAGEDGLALKCARDCLARFPAGRYADRAARLVRKIEAGGSDPAGDDTVPVGGGEQP